VAPKSYVEKQDGLAHDWEGLAFVNPPYGPEVGRWLDKCADHGNAIALVFARVETVAMQRALRQADLVAFLAGRLTFLQPDLTPGKYNGGAPSMLLAYGDEAAQRITGAIERQAIDAIAFTRTDNPTYAQSFNLGRAIQTIADQVDTMRTIQTEMRHHFCP
jgi:hypothetical protein